MRENEIDRHRHRQTDRQIDTNRQTDRYTGRHSLIKSITHNLEMKVNVFPCLGEVFNLFVCFPQLTMYLSLTRIGEEQQSKENFLLLFRQLFYVHLNFLHVFDHKVKTH